MLVARTLARNDFLDFYAYRGFCTIKDVDFMSVEPNIFYDNRYTFIFVLKTVEKAKM